MSQASIPESLPSQGQGSAGQTKPILTLADMVAQAASDLKRVELAKTLLGVAILLSLTALALILVDHWVWPLPAMFRWICLVTLSGGALYWIIRRLLPMFGRRINPIFAARQIEHKVPELKDSLVSYMQLNGTVDGAPKGVVNAIGRFAVDRLSRHNVSEFVSSSTPMRLSAWLFAILVIAGAYFVTSPKSGLDSLVRLIMPWHTIDAPTRVKITKVSPKDVTIARGAKLDVEVELRGVLSGDPIRVEFNSIDGQYVNQIVELKEVISGLTYHGTLTMGEKGIVQDIEYVVRAGDAVAGPYGVRIEQMPVVDIQNIELKFPRYTKLPPMQVNPGSDFEAIEGTTVRINAVSNQKMDLGQVVVNSRSEKADEAGASRSYQLLTDNQSLSGTFPLQLNSNRDDPSAYSYRIEAVSALKQKVTDPSAHEYRVTRDKAPSIEWAQAYPDIVELPVNHVADFSLSATDPDFGVSQIKNILIRGTSKLDERSLLMNEEGISEKVTRIYRFEPRKMGLRAGDQLTLQATVMDNRRDIYDAKWEPNETEGKPLTLRIVGDKKEATKFSEPAEQAKPLPPQPQDGSDVKPNKKPEDQNGEKQDASGDKNSEDADSKDDPGKSDRSSNGTEDGSKSDKQDGQSEKEETASGDKNQSSADSDSTKRDQDKKQDNDGSDNGSKSEQKSDSGSQGGEEEKSQGSGGENASKEGAIGQQAGDKQNGSKESKQSGNESSASNSAEGNESGNESGQEAGEESQDGSQSGSSGANAGKQSGNNKANGNKSSAQGGGESSDSGADAESEASSKSNNRGSGNKGRSSSSNGDASSEGDGGEESGEESGNDSGASADSGSSSKGTNSRSRPNGKGQHPKASDSGEGDSSSEPSEGEPSDDAESSSSNAASSKEKGNRGKLNNVELANRNPDEPMHDGEVFEEINKWIEENGDPADSKQKSQGSEEEPKGDSGNGSQDGGESSNQDKSNDKQQNKSPSGSSDKQDEQRNNPSGVAQPSSNPQAGGNSSESAAQGDKQDQNSNQEGQGNSGQNQGNGDQSQSNKNGQNSDGQNQSNNGGQKQNSTGGNSPSQSGNSPGQNNGQKSDQGQSGNSSGNQPQSSSSSQPSAEGQSGTPANGSVSSGSGSPQPKNGGGASSSSNAKAPEAAKGSSATPTKENLEFTKKQTDLALDYLDRERDQPDPELLKRLGWSAEQLKAFKERWKKAKENSLAPEGDKEEYENDLRALGIAPPSVKKRASIGVDDKLSGLSEEGGHSRPPKSLQGAYEAYRKAAQQRGKK